MGEGAGVVVLENYENAKKGEQRFILKYWGMVFQEMLII